MRASSLPLLLLAAFSASPAQAECPPPGWDLARLQSLKANKLEIDAAERDRLARGLLDCLASPDPELRDGIAYGAWALWLRGKNRPDSPELIGEGAAETLRQQSRVNDEHRRG